MRRLPGGGRVGGPRGIASSRGGGDARERRPTGPTAWRSPGRGYAGGRSAGGCGRPSNRTRFPTLGRIQCQIHCLSLSPILSPCPRSSPTPRLLDLRLLLRHCLRLCQTPGGTHPMIPGTTTMFHPTNTLRWNSPHPSPSVAQRGEGGLWRRGGRGWGEKGERRRGSGANSNMQLRRSSFPQHLPGEGTYPSNKSIHQKSHFHAIFVPCYTSQGYLLPGPGSTHFHVPGPGATTASTAGTA